MNNQERIKTVQRKLMPLPPEMPIYRVDDFIKIWMVGKAAFMAQILQAEQIAPFKLYTTEYGNAVTLASKLGGVNNKETVYKAGDFNDFYEPAENTIEDFILALESDIPIEMASYYPGAVQLFGINKVQLRWNQDVSDKYNPTIRTPIIKGQKPNHDFINLSRATHLDPRFVALWHAGMRYAYDPLTPTTKPGIYVNSCGMELEAKSYSRLNIKPIVTGGY